MKRSTRRSKSPGSKGARLSRSPDLAELMHKMSVKTKRKSRSPTGRKKRRETRGMRIVGSQLPNSALPAAALPAFVLPQPFVLPDLPAHPVFRPESETPAEFRMRKSAFMAEKHRKKD